MTTQEEEVPALPELPVQFMGREIFVRMPTPEQLLVWQRTVDRLTNAPVDASWTGSEVMRALERLRKIVDSILVNRADIDWMDDGFLDGTLNFRALAPFITLAADAYASAAEVDGNRATKRAAKKAARRKVS